MCTPDIFLGLIAVLFPPIAVWVKRGLCSIDSFINIALCCLGFLPGLIHAWYVIAATPDYDYELASQTDPEHGHVVVAHHVVSPGGAAGGPGARAQGAMHYYVRGGRQVQVPAPRTATKYGTLDQRGGGPAVGGAGAGAGAGAGPSAAAQDENVPSDEVPPSYADAVKWDNKVQHP